MTLLKLHLRTIVLLALTLPTLAQSPQLDNKPDRLEAFRDQGLGLFIHWSIDSQLGVIISHSLAGASDDYVTRFYRDLPRTFNPTRFDPDALARLASLSGFRYMVFTTKHHNGFAMWSTATTPFNITQTPYKQDITKQLFQAFRTQNIPTGVYFSPDDFLWLHNNHKQIERLVPAVQPSNNPGLFSLDQAQVTELMTHYGPISAFFFDGEATGLRDIVWRLQPSTVVTRGAIETPEQDVPGAPLPGAWEANMTLGTAWGFQPSDERYKSVQELLRILIHTRARGGNLLLNIGLKPDGSLPEEQEDRIRTLGSWMFINSDAIYATRPWVVTNEGPLWFTRSKGPQIPLHPPLRRKRRRKTPPPTWKRGTTRDFLLKTVRATPQTTIDVLGQNDKIVEYRPDLNPQSTFTQQPDGLHVHVMRAQRLRDSDQWPYPSVIHLTNVEEAFTPPTVHTLPPTKTGPTVTLHGDWQQPTQTPIQSNDTPEATFSFDIRLITGEDTQSRLHAWQPLPTQPAPIPGQYTATFTPTPGERYEVRAVLHHTPHHPLRRPRPSQPIVVLHPPTRIR